MMLQSMHILLLAASLVFAPLADIASDCSAAHSSQHSDSETPEQVIDDHQHHHEDYSGAAQDQKARAEAPDPLSCECCDSNCFARCAPSGTSLLALTNLAPLHSEKSTIRRFDDSASIDSLASAPPLRPPISLS